MRRSHLLAIPTFLLGLPLLAQQVIIVPDNAPDVATAVSLASDGDVIQIRGSYRGVSPQGVILNKSLTIEGEPGHNGELAAPESGGSVVLRIIGLGSKHRVLLRNLQVSTRLHGLDQPRPTPVIAIELASEAGVVVFDNVWAGGGYGRQAVAITGGQGLEILLRHCQFTGSTGNPPFLSGNEIGPPGGNALVLNGPLTAVVEDCTLEGGEGGDAGFDGMRIRNASAGGAAMLSSGAAVAVVGCTLTDGDGGYAHGDPNAPAPNPCQYQGPPGVSNLPTDMFGVLYQPGVAGGATGCPAQQRPPQQSLGRPIDLTIPTTQQPLGQSFVLQAHSLPSSSGWSALLVALELHRIQLPGTQGPLWLDPIFYWMLLPPPSLSGWATVPMPALPAMLGIELDARAQLLHVTWNFGIEFGSPRTMLFVPVGR